MMTEANH